MSGLFEKRFLCPFCFQTHTKKECKLKCDYAAGDSYCYHHFDDNSFFRDEQGFIANDFKAGCLKCKNAVPVLFCPNADTNMIPRAFLSASAGDLPIALAGGKYSGKSHYIAVLIQEIRNKMCSRFGCYLNMNTTDDTRKFYAKKYYDPLYKHHEMLPITARGQIPPMIFRIAFNKKRSVMLSLYDTAGEDMNDLSGIRHFFGAKGIILLIDPTQIASVRDTLLLQGCPINDLPRDYSNPALLADSITALLSSQTQRVKTPLAVVFTKTDVLEKYGIINKGDNTRCLMSESAHMDKAAYSMLEHAATDRAVRMFAQEYVSGVKSLCDYENVAFFGVSSLGAMPSGTHILEAPAPRRVLDPLLWLLMMNKYIPRCD